MANLAIGYVRVSTADQATDGVSLAVQRQRIEAHCVAGGLDLLAVHADEGISGKDVHHRPGLQAALADACGHKAALVVYSLSRMARSTRDTLAIAERLQRADADLVSMSEKLDTTSAAGKMMFRMLAILAEFERDLVSERTSAAMAHKRAKGERISGRIPYGYDLHEDGIQLLPNATEQNALALIRRLRAEGHTLQSIADELQRRGYLTKTGNRTWTTCTILKLTKRAA